MTKTFSALLLFLVFSFSAFAQSDIGAHTPEQQKKARQVAEKWVRILTTGIHLDSLSMISSVPFALDRKKILNSTEELKSFYAEVVESKGKRTLPKFTTTVYASKHEIIENCIPINVLLIEIEFSEGKYRNDQILISVSISGDSYKVCGFTD